MAIKYPNTPPKKLKKKKMSNSAVQLVLSVPCLWESHCNSVMHELNLKSAINHCTRKIILNEDGLSANITKNI